MLELPVVRARSCSGKDVVCPTCVELQKIADIERTKLEELVGVLGCMHA
jgi:hypothetical protein